MTKLQEKASIISAFFFLSLLPLTWAEGQTAPATSQDTVQIKATVVKVAGDVRIKSRASLTWHDAKANEILSAGDQIETKEKGQIELRIENGNVINLKPKSKLVLKTLTRDLKTGDYENLLEVDRGKFRAKVEKIKGSSRFEVKSPTAVACVRGTIMYLIVFSDSTTAFFEEGVGFVTNPFSGQSFDVNPGNIYQIDDNGNVTGPVIPTPEQLKDMTGGWDGGAGEGYSGPEGGDGPGGDTGSNYNFDDVMNDIRNSWDAYLGAGVNNIGGGATIPGGTTPSGGDETDTDGDGIPNIEDAFPIIPNLTRDPDVYGSRDRIRDAIIDSGHKDNGFVNFGTYSQEHGSRNDEDGDEGKVSGGIYDRIERLGGTSYDGTEISDEIRNDLRNDIFEMLKDQEVRYLDSVMERITDAQTAKVLTDAYGYRVRVEQYVLRPDSKTVEVLNISLRTEEAGSLAGLNTLDWKTKFNKSLDTLNSGDIKNLPWNNYLDSYGDSIASPETAGNVYPNKMYIELRNGNNYLSENTNFHERNNERQKIDSKELSFNLTGVGARSGLDIQNRVTDNNPNFWNPVSIRPLNEVNAPDGFKYDVYFGNKKEGEIKSIYASFNVISDAGVNGSMGYDNLKINTLGDALRTNLVSGSSPDIGDNNLQLTVSSKRRNDSNFEDSRLIDVIYVPMPRMTWSDINWDNNSPR